MADVYFDGGGVVARTGITLASDPVDRGPAFDMASDPPSGVPGNVDVGDCRRDGTRGTEGTMSVSTVDTEATTPPRSGSRRTASSPWTSAGSPSGTVRSRSVAVGAVVVDHHRPPSAAANDPEAEGGAEAETEAGETDPPRVRPPEEERDAAMLEAEVLRLRADGMCRALRLLTRQVSTFPAATPGGGPTAAASDWDAGRPAEPAVRRRPEKGGGDGAGDGALRERTNAASDGNGDRDSAGAGEAKDGEDREVTPKAANGRPKKKASSLRILTSPMGKFKRKSSPPPPPPLSAPPAPAASDLGRGGSSGADDDDLALEREIERCLHLLQSSDEDLLLHHHHRPPAVGDGPRGYAEVSNLRNACTRMRDSLRQTSVESDAALAEVRRLRDEGVASRRRRVELERAVCRLHRENAALRSRVARDRRERKNVVRALKDYVSNVKAKRQMLEEEVTRTNVLMHEWALGGRMGGGAGGRGSLPPESPARSCSAGDDEDMSSEVSFCSSVSSLATSSSSVASSRSRVTDEGIAAVRLFGAEESACNGDAAASAAKEKFRSKRRMLHAAAAAGEGRPVYTLTFAQGEKIGLQFQKVTIASIPRDVLVGGGGHEEVSGGGGEAGGAGAGDPHTAADADGGALDDSFQEDDGPWPMPRSRTSTLDDGPRSRASTLEDVRAPRSRASTLEEHDAADLLAAAAASSSVASDHHPACQHPQQHQHQQQQPAPDAFLVCGYRGFVDRGASGSSFHAPPSRRRPTLGARLVAVNGRSLEVGRWTFGDLRAALQAHMAADADHVAELTFRNDRLTRRQKELLNRAVAEVEMGGAGGGDAAGWTSGTMGHVEYPHHPHPPCLREQGQETFHRQLEDEGGNRGGKDGVRDRMRKFSEELFKSSGEDDFDREGSAAPPPAGVEREEHTTTRGRMRKFSEELFKTSPEEEAKKEGASLPQAAPSATSEKEDHKATGADSMKEKMLDLFKSSSGSSNDRDDAKRDTSTTASLFETPKKDEGGGSHGSSSDSVKEKMRKFSEGLSSTFKQLDEESKKEKAHPDSANNPAQGEGKESALKAKMPNFEFSPKFKKFF